MASKKQTKNGPGNNKAYAPVPKGYKGNWNVPAGTPWKKDSPYNPANAPAAKKAAEAKSLRTAVAKNRAAIAAKKEAQKTTVTSRAPSPAALAAARKAKSTSASRSAAVSDSKFTAMAKAGKQTVAAKKKAVASYPTPSQRAGSMANIKRAAETRRAGQRASAAASSRMTNSANASRIKAKTGKMK